MMRLRLQLISFIQYTLRPVTLFAIVRGMTSARPASPSLKHVVAVKHAARQDGMAS